MVVPTGWSTNGGAHRLLGLLRSLVCVLALLATQVALRESRIVLLLLVLSLVLALVALAVALVMVARFCLELGPLRLNCSGSKAGLARGWTHCKDPTA